MMVIAIDARCVQPHFPGIGRYARNLIRAMAENGAERILAITAEVPAGLFPSTVTCIPVPARVRSLQEQWAVPRALRRLSPTIYHAPYFFRPFLIPVPTIVTIHDVIPAEFPSSLPSRDHHLVYRLAMRLSLASARRVLVPSSSTRESLARHFGVEKQMMVITPYGVEPRFYPGAIRDIDRVRNRYHLPDDYLLFVGVNKPHKNLRRLVQAFARVARSRPEQLVLAGPWDVRYGDVVAEIDRQGLSDRVEILGMVDDEDLPALYAGAALFVFPSLYEGFGLPVLEAMSSGTPVVCSSASSLPELVGDAALTCDSSDPDSIADVILRALNDSPLRDRLRRRGIERSRTFSWETTARLTLDAYREILP